MKYFVIICLCILSNGHAQSTPDATSLEPTTSESITSEPATAQPITPEPDTSEQTTLEPITPEPITPAPTTIEPITPEPTTIEPITPAPTTIEPITPEPTTIEPSTPEPTTTIPIYFLSESEPEVTWKPGSTSSVVIEADEGYKIAVNVTECNIDGENGEYATISTDEMTNGLTFTYTVSNEPAYLFNTHILYGYFYGTNASNFTAIFTKIGEPLTTTTTDIPTTTISLPTAGEDVSSTLLVYLIGKAPLEYDDEMVQQLIDSLVRMATEYCDNENFPLNGTITSSNIIIYNLGHCSMNWPDSEVCVQLNFSVPVNLLDDSDSVWTGYQMTTEHLRIMWDRYAVSELPDGISYYYQPDTSSTKWGIYIATGVIVAFVICMALVQYCYGRVTKVMRRRKLSDTTSIITASDRNSITSLPPHYLQETPPLFENAYPMYNPEKSPTFPEPSYPKPHEYEGYHDLSVDIQQRAGEDEEESGA